MNMIFKVLMYGIMLNFAVGIMTMALPGFDEGHPDRVGGLIYNQNDADLFVSTMNKSVTPGGELEDKGNEIYRVLDMINLGFIFTIIEVVDTFMFGFVKLLQTVFGSYISPPELSTFIFSLLRGFVLIGYALGGWWLFTGKNLDET